MEGLRCGIARHEGPRSAVIAINTDSARFLWSQIGLLPHLSNSGTWTGTCCVDSVSW